MAYEAIFGGLNPWVIFLISLWTIPWKGVAMWKSAKNNQMIWFVVFLVVNLLAIPEIVYIFFFQKKVKKKK